MFWELFFEHLRAAQRVLGAVFGKLYRGTVCFRSCFVNTLRRHSLFWELFFEDFTGAQRVLEAVFRSPQGGTACFGNCFSNTLGRHSAFWELVFAFLRAAQLVLGFVCENFRAAQRVLDDFFDGFGVCAALGFRRTLWGGTGVLALKYTY